MSNGNLRNFLEAHPGHDRLLACFEVSSGLKYLHGLNPHVYHRDIKAVNILVKDDGVCCLSDFGLSSIAGSQRLESKSFAGGTMHWQPPEVVLADSTVSFEHNLDSAAADVYAYGCMVHEVYTGTHPFFELKQGALIRALAEKRRPTLDGVDAAFEISKQFRALINSCWNDAPERPTMSRINSEIEKELKSYFCRGCDACENLERRQLKAVVRSTSPSQSEPILTGVLSEETLGGPGNPTQSLSSGLMTPPATGNDSPVIAEPLGNTRFEITEERDSTGKDVLGIILPRSEIRGTSRSLTPPETPTRTLDKIQLSAHSPPFCPSPGLKIRAHRLNLDAAEFTPRGFTKNPLNWQAKEFVPLGKGHFVGKDGTRSTLDASSRGLNPHAQSFIRDSPTRIFPS
ncbi:hypothetical protein H0H93_016694 [Arthromyces matolae]|nr:hypothetical protein H0H93_016694 [Arthromyces matolae]